MALMAFERKSTPTLRRYDVLSDETIFRQTEIALSEVTERKIRENSFRSLAPKYFGWVCNINCYYQCFPTFLVHSSLLDYENLAASLCS